MGTPSAVLGLIGGRRSVSPPNTKSPSMPRAASWSICARSSFGSPRELVSSTAWFVVPKVFSAPISAEALMGFRYPRSSAVLRTRRLVCAASWPVSFNAFETVAFDTFAATAMSSNVTR